MNTTVLAVGYTIFGAFAETMALGPSTLKKSIRIFNYRVLVGLKSPKLPSQALMKMRDLGPRLSDSLIPLDFMAMFILLFL
uniref:Uncharacterized protein n=1 Tax=Acrobeloides nanus TaxID=290746 RepID=A0A914DB61_9BILA